MLENGEKTQLESFIRIIESLLPYKTKEKIMKKFKQIYMMPDELEEPNLKYENEEMYNLYNLIKRDEKEFLNGDKVIPEALADDLGEFKD